VGPEDWQPQLRGLAERFVQEPVLFTDAYQASYPAHLPPRPWWTPQIVWLADRAIWAGENLAGHHQRVESGRPPQELLVVTATKVIEAELTWRAGEGWSSNRVVRSWARLTVLCRQVDDDYGLELAEAISTDHVVLHPVSLNPTSVRIARELLSTNQANGRAR
jgi:hypothetical protein